MGVFDGIVDAVTGDDKTEAETSAPEVSDPGTPTPPPSPSDPTEAETRAPKVSDPPGVDPDPPERTIDRGDSVDLGGDTSDDNTADRARDRPTRPDVDPVSVDSTADPVNTAIDAVTSPVTDAVDFVTSGPDEPSVGDPGFDPVATGNTTVSVDTVATGNNTTTVDPSRPSTGINQDLVNETTDSGGLFAENETATGAVLPGEVAGVDISENRLEGLAGYGANVSERIRTKDTTGAPVAAPSAGGVLNSPIVNDAAGNTIQGATALPGQVESTLEFTQNAPLNLNSVGTAGAVATTATKATARKAVTDPAEFGAEVGFGFATGTATSRVGLRAADPAPVSTRTARFATGEDSFTTARSLELGTESRNVRPISTTGVRPTTGTPDVDLDNVDLRRQGEAAGPAFEPQTRFEADVVEQSLRERGNTEAADRIDAVTEVIDDAEGVATESVTRQQLEDTIADVERVEGNPTQIVDELAEQDATVFGSGAVRAQRPDFRTPGDVDAVVPESNIAQADARLGGLGDFDLKPPDRFAGLREGENFGFGTTSRSPIDVEDADGLGVNPIGEEIQRKAGASGFLRRRIDQEGELDVGPRPSFDARNPSGFDFSARQKDVTDAAELAEVGFGATDPTTRQFRRAFGLDDSVPAGATPSRRGLGFDIDEFVGETRAQAALTRPTRRGAVDVGETRIVDGDTDSSSPTVDGDSDVAVDTTRSPSPSRTPSVESPSRLPGLVGGSSIFGISPDSSPTIGGSPGSSTPTGTSPDSPSPGDTPTDSTSPSPTGADSPGPSPSPSLGLGGSLFAGSPVVSDSPSGSPADSPSPSPVFGGSPSPSPSPGDSPGDRPSPNDSPGNSPGEGGSTPSSPISPANPPSPPSRPIGGGSPGQTPTNPTDEPRRSNRDVEFDEEGEPTEKEFDITDLDALFDSGILSGQEALDLLGDRQ